MKWPRSFVAERAVSNSTGRFKTPKMQEDEVLMSRRVWSRCRETACPKGFAAGSVRFGRRWAGFRVPLCR